MADQLPFNEDSLRADIVKVWGEFGAHTDVFDFVVKKARQASDYALLLGAWHGEHHPDVTVTDCPDTLCAAARRA